jgi:hypothetical protein
MPPKRKSAPSAADSDTTSSAAGPQPSDFRFCSVAEVDRLIAIMNGALLISGTDITPGMRLAFGAHQIRQALVEAAKLAKPPATGPAVQGYLLEAVAQLLNQICATEAKLAIVHPKPQGGLH